MKFIAASSLSATLSSKLLTVRDSTRFLPNFEGAHRGVGQGPPTSIGFPKPSSKVLRLDGLLDSNLNPTTQKSASLITTASRRLKVLYVVATDATWSAKARSRPTKIHHGKGLSDVCR
ncbi:hypothetical protein TNCV_58261 [Trichonephila clavipes]|nr:hypothetical protein TNCV_58261 [Trichonephila clavipes]